MKFGQPTACCVVEVNNIEDAVSCCNLFAFGVDRRGCCSFSFGSRTPPSQVPFQHSPFLIYDFRRFALPWRRLSLQRKRAAGDSEREWSEPSDDSDSDYSSCDDDSDAGNGRGGGARAKKEAAFAKVLKDMMDKRDTAEPGVLQEVRARLFR